MNPKRVALRFLIVSVALSGAMGIVAIVSGSFGDLEGRIILTTLTISGSSICGLACGALWEKGGPKIFALAGIALAVVTAGLFITGIWARINSEEFWKFSASVGIIAVATAHSCLLLLAKLARRFAWSRPLAITAIYSLAVTFVFIVYFTRATGDFGIRVVGVTSILAAAFTILTPVFHRLSRGDLDVVGRGIDGTRRVHPTISCPLCGTSLPNASGNIGCNQCGCSFQVTILDAGPARAQQKDS
jgi:hypothetical protein